VFLVTLLPSRPSLGCQVSHSAGSIPGAPVVRLAVGPRAADLGRGGGEVVEPDGPL